MNSSRGGALKVEVYLNFTMNIGYTSSQEERIFYYFYIKFEVTNTCRFFSVIAIFFKHPTFAFITQGLSCIALHESSGRKMGKYNGRFVYRRESAIENIKVSKHN